MEEDKKMEDFYTVEDGIATITNLPEFVKAGLSSGKLIAKKAKKVAPVIFEYSTEDYVKNYGDGEQATLDVEFNLGEEGKYIETTETVKPNPKKFIARGAKYGETWQVNRSNYEDTPLTKDDIIGNLDIDDNVKANLLKALEDGKEIYMPTPDNRYTVKIDIPEVNEIRFQAPWNANEEYQTIRNGGYVVLGENDRISTCNKVNMFGNQQFTFKSSYKEEEGEYNQELISLINQAQMEVLNKKSEDIKENPEELEGGMQGAVTLKDSLIGSNMPAPVKTKPSIFARIASKIKSFFGRKDSDKKTDESSIKEETQVNEKLGSTLDRYIVENPTHGQKREENGIPLYAGNGANVAMINGDLNKAKAKAKAEAEAADRSER